MEKVQLVTKELFESALRSFFNNQNITIQGYTSRAAVPAGDNYTSDLFRCSVTYKTGLTGSQDTISLIVKCSPESRPHMSELVKQVQLFDKEINMFTKTLPAIYEILGEFWTLSAKFIYYTTKTCSIIIFEDLSPMGFKMLDRHVGMDLEHCLLVIEKMACLHAASVVLHDKDPSLVNYNEGIYAENPAIFAWMTEGLESLIKASSAWPGFEKYSMKLSALRDKYVTRGLTSAKRKLGGFNVLNHGDTWINNLMFSYTPDGKLNDFRYVDYQLIVYSSPAVDLHYFWATSPNVAVQREHLETILDYYYALLLANLTKLQYSLERVPTKKQFRKDWKSRAFYGLVSAATVLPLVKATSRTDATFEDLMATDKDEAGFRHHAYNNDRFRQHMEYLLPFFDDLGALDYY